MKNNLIRQEDDEDLEQVSVLSESIRFDGGEFSNTLTESRSKRIQERNHSEEMIDF